MLFSPPLTQATLLKRYKRFLADIKLDNGEIITIHCPNTGPMTNCFKEGETIWFLPSTDPNRKTKGTWVLSTASFGRTANVNTHLANDLVEEALNSGLITEVGDFEILKREVRYGEENSRIDFCLTHQDKSQTYLEVKSVTLGFKDKTIAAFPDAVTTRGTKHLRELTTLAKVGIKTVLFYCVNITGMEGVRPADEIDADYGKALREAVEAGVKVMAYNVTMSPEEIKITHAIPVIID